MILSAVRTLVAIVSLIAGLITIVQAQPNGQVESKRNIAEGTILFFNEMAEAVASKEQSHYYRKVLSNAANKGWLVQDFYSKSDRKMTDPFITTHVTSLPVMSIDGTVTIWSEEGVKWMQMSFKNGIKEGYFTTWYPSGQKYIENLYGADGRLISATTWFESGSKQQELLVDVTTGQGVEVELSEQGIKLVERLYQDGQLQKLTAYYDSGSKKSEIFYKNERRNGLSIEWYENGQKMTEANYVEDELNGELNSWYETGEKQLQITFVNGIAKGKSIEWHKNGQKRAECIYKEDSRQDVCRNWNEQGQKE